MTWVAFHQTIAEKARDLSSVDSALAMESIFIPDRSYILGPAKPAFRAWEQAKIATDFQATRLRQSTTDLVRHRKELLETSSGAFRRGECSSTLNCPIEPEADGGMLEACGVQCGMLIPSHWFWYQVGRPQWDADAMGAVKDRRSSQVCLCARVCL